MMILPAAPDVAAFALVSLAMACTPGPNMMYLLSRTVSQGPRAGMISLAGVSAAFVTYMVASVLGLTALLIAVPYAYDTLRLAGAAYLLWLAWQAVRPGGRTPFEVRDLVADTPRKLIAMGFLTNILNPKAAVLHMSLLPQFIEPERGGVLGQALALGSTQIAISMAVNTVVILTAGRIAALLARRPAWQTAQRWLTGAVLGGLALRMATESRR